MSIRPPSGDAEAAVRIYGFGVQKRDLAEDTNLKFSIDEFVNLGTLGPRFGSGYR